MFPFVALVSADPCVALRRASDQDSSGEEAPVTLCDEVRLCGARGAVDCHSGHDSVTLGRNSRKRSSQNIVVVSLIGSSSPPGEARRAARRGPLWRIEAARV